MRPSRVIATFIRTRGRLCWIQRAKPSLRRRASALADSDFCLKAGRTQCFHAVAGDVGVGIDGGGDHARQARGDEGLSAGAGAAGVVAGLEGDVGGAAAQTVLFLIGEGVLPGFVESDDFSVVEQVVLVPALADDLSGAIEDDAADGGIGRG